MEDSRVKVLLVEDEPASRALLETMLRDLHGARCEVAIAPRLSDAQARLGAGDCDLVLLDLSLPDSQGLATYQAVRERAPSIPVVVLTGPDDDPLAFRAMREGSQDYLVKGQVDGPTLRRVIRYALERKRAEEALRERKETVEVLRQALSDLKQSHEELMATQRELRHSEKLEIISTFAAGVAHEVKNPLQALILGIDYLATHMVNGDPGAAVVLEEMSQAVQRTDAIIRGLMEFSAHRPGEVRSLDLSAIVEQALCSVASELADNPIVLVKDLAVDLPPLRLDLKTMKHVFISLLANAIRSMPDGGTLTVRTRARRLAAGDSALAGGSMPWRPGDWLVEAEVGDTGAGLLETQVRARDAQAGRRPTRRGTGLGLTVVRKLVELYGGTIEVLNRPEGGGQVSIRFVTQPAQAP